MAKIKIRKILESDYKEIKAFIVSSVNAIEAIKSDINLITFVSEKHSIYCVGQHTAEVGKAIGLETICYGLRASDLMERLRTGLVNRTFHALPREICYLRGNKIAKNISGPLGIFEKIVYCQCPCEIYSDIKLKVIKGDIGIFFSFQKIRLICFSRESMLYIPD